MKVLQSENIWIGFRNTIFYADRGNGGKYADHNLRAYPLSRKVFLLK